MEGFIVDDLGGLFWFLEFVGIKLDLILPAFL